jgi:hypothetical protein
MAQPVEVAISKKIDNLNAELKQAMEITWRKDSEPIMPERDVATIFAEIDVLEADLLKLRTLRDEANLVATVSWRLTPADKLMSVTEALGRVKQMRSRLQLYRNMSCANPNATITRWDENNLNQITYQPAVYKTKADQLEKQVNALSMAIDIANVKQMVDFDASAYVEGLV